jgi:large subunit ribosomal protein LP0
MIQQGQITITQDVCILEVGDKVDNSTATLLKMLEKLPFNYALKIIKIYDNGFIYDPSILDLEEDYYENLFLEGIENIAKISLSTNSITKASIPHILCNAFLNILSIPLSIKNYDFKESLIIKEFIMMNQNNNESKKIIKEEINVKKEIKKGDEINCLEEEEIFVSYDLFGDLFD